jgi:polar amino acid transport system substrate-binding protein
VAVEFKTVTAVNRLPMLMGNRVNILAAAMTKTPERAQEIDFSHTYFLTGQKFLAKKGTIKSLKDLEGKKVATARGTTAERNMATAVPFATILPFDDYPQGIRAVLQGKVAAVTTDESILAGQLCLLEKNSATRGKYEIPEVQISTELYGLGIRKNDADFLKFVNDTLLEMEKNGEAKKIFQRWFGPKSESPITRSGSIISGDQLVSN